MMPTSLPEIVAHRGVPGSARENTLPAFLRAIKLGADAVELDVRLTADQVPVVYHYFYLDEQSGLSGAIFNQRWETIRSTGVISSLQEVLETLDGRIGLEVEIKGPEPQSAEIVAGCLVNFQKDLQHLEVTSYEPLLLERFREICPGVPTDLLIPLSEPWMKNDVLAYNSVQRAHLAGARAVHLHSTQLDREVVKYIRQNNLEVHAWGINDHPGLQTAFNFGIPRICTDNLALALEFRTGYLQ